MPSTNLDRVRWEYNSIDCATTWELVGKMTALAEKAGVSDHASFQQSLFFPVLRMMTRGLRRDETKRKAFRNALCAAQIDRQSNLDYIIGRSINPRSNTQLPDLFYRDLGQPKQLSQATGNPTTGAGALAALAEREPLLLPLCQLIAELRSIGVFLGTFIDATADIDGRIRCSFSIPGTASNRFSSSTDAFGSGMNLQNIPKETKKKVKSKNYISLPNLRELFIPDPGWEFFDMDLSRADLYAVVWEASDPELKLVLQRGIDMHCYSACSIFDIKGIPFDELSESHPNYPDHRGKIGERFRQLAKMGVHAVNYGVGDRKLAMALGITVKEAADFKSKWFGAHPRIEAWHTRIDSEARTRRYIQNPFGAKFHVFGNSYNLPELLAWGPQSTVAGTINRILRRIDDSEQSGAVKTALLLQVHDSLGGQFPVSDRAACLDNLKECAKITIPYPDDTLTIPVGIKTSTLSWGHCE